MHLYRWQRYLNLLIETSDLRRLFMRIPQGLWSFSERAGDRLLNIKTAGKRFGYLYTDYRLLKKIFRHVRVGPSERFVDYGCGEGRVVCYAARLGFKKVTGIEINPDIAAAARKNVQNMKGRIAPAEIVEADVLKAFDCGEETVFYFFSPFKEQADLTAVLNDIGRSQESRPRGIQIIYHGFLRQEGDNILKMHPWLKKTREIRSTIPRDRMNEPCYVRFYSNGL